MQAPLWATLYSQVFQAFKGSKAKAGLFENKWPTSQAFGAKVVKHSGLVKLRPRMTDNQQEMRSDHWFCFFRPMLPRSSIVKGAVRVYKEKSGTGYSRTSSMPHT